MSDVGPVGSASKQVAALSELPGPQFALSIDCMSRNGLRMQIEDFDGFLARARDVAWLVDGSRRADYLRRLDHVEADVRTAANSTVLDTPMGVREIQRAVGWSLFDLGRIVREFFRRDTADLRV